LTKFKPRTLFDKIWDFHVVETLPDGTAILYIDRHLVHEVTSPQAFEGLRAAGRRVRQPGATIAVADHNVPTSPGRVGGDADGIIQLETLEKNVAEFAVPYIPIEDARQGIVHVIGPEQGLSLPGMTIVCGDSHTSTHGAMGALAFGIGTSEVEHVLATQTILQKPAKNMRVTVKNRLGPSVYAKDLALAIIARIGTAGGTGHVIEYAGEGVRALDMAGRMTLCNMSIEAGARAGLVAPDETTFAYIEGRPFAPKGEAFDQAVAYWSALPSDPEAHFDTEIEIDATEIAPMVTWGTSPEAAAAITAHAPNPADVADEAARAQMVRALDYMGLEPGQAFTAAKIDVVFVGSCTNSRIEDIREVARIAKGQKVAEGVRALVVPGSGLVKLQAEAEGLEPRSPDAGPAVRLHLQPQFRRSAGTGRAHPPGFARHGGSQRHRRPSGRSSRLSLKRTYAVLHHPHRYRRGPAQGQRRYRPDHPGTVPENYSAHGPRPGSLRQLPLRRGGPGRPGFRVEPETLPQGPNPDCARELRLWLLT
jgi:3-isopropylmalate/(R)-2-methylmalate dehydratase large subunit